MRSSTVALTALAPMTWGTTYAVTAEWLPADRPLLAATLRALPVGIVLTLAGRRLPSGVWWLRSIVLGFLSFGAFFALLFTAAYRLPGGLAATIGAFQPVVVTVLAALLLAERPRPRRLAAAGLGIVGVALLVLRSDATLDALGVLAALGATSSMATASVLVQRWGRPAPLLTFAGWQLAAGGLMLAPVALLVEGLPDRVTATNLGGYLYLMVIGAGMAYPLWFRGIERLGAGAATFLGLLSPVVATLVGVGLRGEDMAPLQVVGAVAVLGGVLLGQRGRAFEMSPSRTSTCEVAHRVGRPAVSADRASVAFDVGVAGDEAGVAVVGPLTHDHVDDLLAAVDGALGEAVDLLVIDLSECDVVDLAGARALDAVVRRCTEAGACCVVHGADRFVRHLVEGLGLDVPLR